LEVCCDAVSADQALPAINGTHPVRKVLAGDMHLSEKLASSLVSRFTHGAPDQPATPIETLSDRELEVFRMLGQGKGARQIAADLQVTVATVNSFRNRIKEKLGLKTSTEVMLYAIQWVQGEASR
jgi:DNA-binding NarL/FixJ family response regulator